MYFLLHHSIFFIVKTKKTHYHQWQNDLKLTCSIIDPRLFGLKNITQIDFKI